MMTDLTSKLVVHCFGESDYTSLVFPKSIFAGMPKVFGTKQGDEFAQVAGTILASGKWPELESREIRDGVTFRELLFRAVLNLVSDTDTVNTAISGGLNLVIIGLYKSDDDEDGEPVYSVRFLGASRTETDDPTSHAALAIEGIVGIAPLIMRDYEEGNIAEDSFMIRTLRARKLDEEARESLPASVLFHEVDAGNGLETAVVVACDDDLALSCGQADKLPVGLISGVVPTPFGAVGYWLWRIGVGLKSEFIQEQFVDIYDLDHAIFQRMKKQELTRVLIVDRDTRRCSRAVALRTAEMNVDSFEQMAREAADDDGHDFEKACRYVMQTVDPEKFIELVEQEASGSA